MSHAASSSSMTRLRGRCPKGPGAAFQGSVRTLKEPDLGRGPEVLRSDGALRHRPTDEPRHLRGLCGDPARSHAVTGRAMWSSSTIWPPTKAPEPKPPSRPVAHGCCSCRPTAPTQPHRNGLLQAQGPPARQSHPHHRRPLAGNCTSANWSILWNAETTSMAPDIRECTTP